jgi:hypothetical protein
MTGATDLAKLVPGFEFLQNLMKGAGASIPGMSQWIAPTLDPEELDKRIQELKTVQFWLEQNARLLGTTIQALEVQRMTLNTLQTMNLPMQDLREALKARPSAPAAAPPPDAEEEDEEAAEEKTPARPARKPPTRRAAAAPAAAAPAAVDPMQWWGALTQQFTEIAAKAVKDSTADAARNLAGAAVKQGVAVAGSTLKKAAGLPAKAVRATVPRKRAR